MLQVNQLASSPQAVIESVLGSIYLGEQQNKAGVVVGHMFNDAETGSTLMMRPEEITPSGVREKIEASRRLRK